MSGGADSRVDALCSHFLNAGAACRQTGEPHDVAVDGAGGCLTVQTGVQEGTAIGTGLDSQKSLPLQTQVDHFVPWSRYPADFGHNFVLAHNGCNSAQSDHLAAENHLAAWVERNRVYQAELQSRLHEAAFPCDSNVSIQIARWVYQQTEKANGQVWVKEKVLKHLRHSWSPCLSA